MKERFKKLKIELNKLAKVKKKIFYNKVNKKQLPHSSRYKSPKNFFFITKCVS